MKRKSKKPREKRVIDKILNEAAKRSAVIMLLYFIVVLLVTRPPWAVKAMRLLIGAVKGVGTYL
jgi:hypothetical protein